MVSIGPPLVLCVLYDSRVPSQNKSEDLPLKKKTPQTLTFRRILSLPSPSLSLSVSQPQTLALFISPQPRALFQQQSPFGVKAPASGPDRCSLPAKSYVVRAVLPYDALSSRQKLPILAANSSLALSDPTNLSNQTG